MFAYCRGVDGGDIPQVIAMPEAVARRVRLTEKAMARAQAMVDGNVEEVDWDVDRSSHPRVITRKFPFCTGRAERVETPCPVGVFYAQVQRRGAPIWGRFIRGCKGAMVRSQTVILRPVGQGEGGWHVVAAYVGDPAPAFPGDPFADARSRGYWATHALVDGALPYQKDTETTKCPW